MFNIKTIVVVPLFLLFLSCSKPDEEGPQIETLEPHSTWSDSSPNTFFED
ncbi:MAG: hypothetical protein J6X88_04240 [Bacteroidales bacterium]|nr:hypothetical protein [Bacteroidales bacterium]